MATASGPEDIDIARWPISGMLDREPYRFEFFQAVRLLSRMYPHRAVAGRFKTYQLIQTDSGMAVAPYQGAVAWWSDTQRLDPSCRGRLSNKRRNE